MEGSKEEAAMKEQSPKDNPAGAHQRSESPKAEPDTVFAEQQGHSASHIPRARLHPRVPSPPDIVALQRTLGNRAVSRLLQAHPTHAAVHPTAQAPQAPLRQPLAESSRAGRPAPIQRITLPEAIEIADALNGQKDPQFMRQIYPVLLAMARKKGQDLATFLEGLDAYAYADIIKELLQPIKLQKVQSPATHPITCEPSRDFPGFQQVVGTNIYLHWGSCDTVKETAQPSGFGALFGFGKAETKTHMVPSADADAFVQSILQTGPLPWYRGMAIDHFAWEGLRQGSLASEGTDKDPNFTMSTSGPLTRWLPGATGPDGRWTASVIAGSIQEEAIANLWQDVDVMMGAVLNYQVTPQTPIAYMNGNEQLLRGPLNEPGLQVAYLAFRGPSGLRFERPANSSPLALPPTYPYQAALGSYQFVTWVHEYNQWAKNQKYAEIPIPQGALTVLSDELTLSLTPDLSLHMAFAILELPFQPTLELDLLKRQYKMLALRHHPDRKREESEKEEATERFQHLQQAYKRITEGAKEHEIKLLT
jgi:hypothetical protein